MKSLGKFTLGTLILVIGLVSCPTKIAAEQKYSASQQATGQRIEQTIEKYGQNPDLRTKYSGDKGGTFKYVLAYSPEEARLSIKREKQKRTKEPEYTLYILDKKQTKWGTIDEVIFKFKSESEKDTKIIKHPGQEISQKLDEIYSLITKKIADDSKEEVTANQICKTIDDFCEQYFLNNRNIFSYEQFNEAQVSEGKSSGLKRLSENLTKMRKATQKAKQRTETISDSTLEAFLALFFR